MTHFASFAFPSFFSTIGLAFLIASSLRGDFEAALPGFRRGVAFAEDYVDIAEVIENLDVLRRLVFERLEQILLGFLILLLLEQHPAKAVEIGAVVVIRFRIEALGLFLRRSRSSSSALRISFSASSSFISLSAQM